MITVEVDDAAVRARFVAMPEKIHRSVLRAVTVLAEKLRTHVVRDKLVGQVLNRRSGRLGQSIQQQVDDSASSITGTVYSAGDVKYARIHEYGGVIPAHVITPKTASVLAFEYLGKTVFAKHVNMPAVTIPQRSYMRSSLADMKEEILDRLRAAAGEGTQ